MTPRTLLLTRSEVERLVDPRPLVADLAAAFRGYSATPGARAQRARASLPGRGTATVLFPGVGLAFQDLVVAWRVYEAARAAGVGREVDFLG